MATDVREWEIAVIGIPQISLRAIVCDLDFGSIDWLQQVVISM